MERSNGDEGEGGGVVVVVVVPEVLVVVWWRIPRRVGSCSESKRSALCI